MIYLNLFWTFFKIGLFTIGGGYAMIPLINAEVISHNWLTEAQLIDFIAISESTPGTFAVNIATFVGATTAGVFGAICTTLGVVLPSLIIIILIAKVFNKLTDKTLVKDAFSGLRPAVVGLIGYAFIKLTAEVIFANVSLSDLSTFKDADFWAIGIFAILFTLSQIKFPLPTFKKPALEQTGENTAVKKYKKIKLHPIVIILISAALGIIVYGVILK